MAHTISLAEQPVLPVACWGRCGGGGGREGGREWGWSGSRSGESRFQEESR